MTAYTYKLSDKVALFFYSLVICLTVIPVQTLRYWLSLLTGSASSIRYRQRLGHIPPDIPKNALLFHCVSVGEVVAASCVIKKLRNSRPDVDIVVSTTTATGRDQIKANFGESISHVYLPYDSPRRIKKWLSVLKARAVIITEVELWPNLIDNCFKLYIPVIVINARMTDRSAASYGKISALFTPMLHKLSHVCAQGQRDHENYLKLGIAKQKLTLTNNIKFDQVASLSTSETGQFLNLSAGERPVLVGGSTHEPEEDALLDTLEALLPFHPAMLLILVPRHPERFSVVKRLIAQRKLSYIQTSQVEAIPEDCQVVLVDEMGKLNQVYQVATIAFVGGSLADRGGHNALEPAAVSLPIIMGPHIYNNPVICAYLQEQGALYVADDVAKITQQCALWMDEPQQAKSAGKAGRAVLDNNRGALDKTLLALQQVLD